MASSDPAVRGSPGSESPKAGWRPERLGPYRILRTLGEGGMGTVYLAEQTEPMKRRVALKVVRPGLVRGETIRRFEVERQALARMNHPHIARAYEAGETDDGQPYFVMEYVPGLPITRYCDEKRLSIEKRLALFEAVCDGVQHLHQKGVLHRDLKPSNVLVTEDGDRPVPKIIDFGIAKALDQPLTDGTVFTGEGMIGTPSYLSPEAIRTSSGGLDVDTRADVYALGVLLYELLTGELPFGGAGESFLEVVRRITEEEALLPSARLAALGAEACAERSRSRGLDAPSLGRRLRADLDWITRKAMAKERARRYGSAAELADDLRRHRRHEPVSAGPPGAAYRVAKFVRRHRSGVASGLLIVLVLVGGIAARTLEARRANREAQRASQEAQRANREAAAARQVSDFLVDLFEVSDPDQAASGAMTAREILDRGAEKLSAEELADQPLLQARLKGTIGVVYSNLGLLEPAAELLEQALEIRRGHPGLEPAEWVGSLNDLGNVHRLRGRFPEAQSIYEEALAASEESLAPDHHAAWRTLANLGVLASTRGDFASAESYLRRAHAVKEKRLGSDHPGVAVSFINLGNISWHQGQLDEAERMFQRALAGFERGLGPGHPRVAAALNNLAAVFYQQGRFDESEAAHRRALAINREALGPNHPEIARSLSNLAEVFWRQGRYAASEAAFLEALVIWEESLGRDHPDLAHPLLGLANLYRDRGRDLEAESLYQRALDLRERSLAADHPDLLQAVDDYAAHLRATGREAAAERLEARVRGRRDEVAGETPSNEP